MKLNTLKLVNFRNYENEFIEFGDFLNIIYGNNGEGKTNLVEAIYTLSLTKSFRTNNDKNLIKRGELSTKIEGEVNNIINNKYQIIINKEGKKVKINDNIQSKMSDYISNINVIILKPDEQVIFDESPSSRRKLLNIEISQLDKNYLLYLNKYNRVIKQRNFYLREMYINGNTSIDYLNVLTSRLISIGKRIYNMRKKFIDDINIYINTHYHDIFENGELNIKYISDYNNKNDNQILEMYKKNYKKEMNYGKTLFGIHHDDLIFNLDGENIAFWGSNGQKKNAILSFKLSELDVFNNEKNTKPILILDDIFSALDIKKIKNIIKFLNKDIQTFITTTDLSKINKKLISSAKVYKVENGKVKEIQYGRE